MENKGLRIEELRATNYVRDFEGKEDEVAALGNFSYSYWIEEDWSAIPLTEEWLEKFGFLLTEDDLGFGFFEWRKTHENGRPDFGILVNGVEGLSKFQFYCGGWNGDYLKYVHQLQNLYFALTGEELVLADR